MFSNSSESSEDIIYETPPRKLRKHVKNRNKKVNNAHRFEDILIEPREEFKEKVRIVTTSVGSENRPYVYRTIDELLDFSDTCFPKNNNCHLVANLRYHDKFGHCLFNNSPDSKFIQVDMKLVSSTPSNGDLISVYGSLEYMEGCFNNLILVVRFFRPEASAIVNEYKKNLMLMRCFVPSCHLSTISLRM